MASRADVMGWQEYVTLELERYAEHTAGNGRLWAETAGAARFVTRRRAGSPEELAFSGPWHVVRPHVTQEFRQWVEEYEGTERLTLSQWVERQRVERASVAYVESAAHTLGQLEEIRRVVRERDALILQAARRGASKVDIARASGITRQQVHAILSREIDALEPTEVLAPVTPISAAHGAPVADSGEVAPEWRQLADGEWVEVF